MLRIEGLSVSVGEFSLTDIHLQVDPGDYFVVLGMSGAGKSLLLETIAGVVTPQTGRIYINNRDVTFTRIRKRGAGLVYQDHALFPHMTVADNIAFPLRSIRTGKVAMDQSVQRLATEMNIRHLLTRKPGTLSGGEQQRVALARTLAMNPSVLLLDEPLASLDIQLKTGLRRLLRKINQQGIPMLHVTHDYEEAITLANKVAVLHDGSIIQSGTIQEVFQHPRSAFIANFIGIKNFFRTQILPCPLAADRDLCQARITPEIIFQLQQPASGEGFIILRAEDVLISHTHPETSARNRFQGTVTEIVPGTKGHEITIDIGIPVTAVISRKSMEILQLREGKKAWISFKASALKFIEG